MSTYQAYSPLATSDQQQSSTIEAKPYQQSASGPTVSAVPGQRNVVVIQDSGSAEITRAVLIGCCIFWILFLILIMILVIVYETKDDDYY
jgi:hypothetical protein